LVSRPGRRFDAGVDTVAQSVRITIGGNPLQLKLGTEKAVEAVVGKVAWAASLDAVLLLLLLDLGRRPVFAAGIVDPAKVTRSALQNAASIAAMVLTTEALVTEIPEKKERPPPVASSRLSAIQRRPDTSGPTTITALAASAARGQAGRRLRTQETSGRRRESALRPSPRPL
jgi:hypothetical protein